MGTIIQCGGAPGRQRQTALLAHPDHMWRRLRVRGKNEDLEKLPGFRPGGYYPVHLQDELHDAQYRVIHKLGHGGLSTVWLCRDQRADVPKYVAIKILVASEKMEENADLRLAAAMKQIGIDATTAGQHIGLVQGRFLSRSPNGEHVCLVLPVLGPTVHNIAESLGSGECLPRTVQIISRQVVEALGALHKNNYCHGDLRPSNILLGLHSLDGLETDEVLAHLGEPETTDVLIRNVDRLSPDVPHAPKYLVYPVDFASVDVESILSRAYIIDFGQSFDTSHPPTRFGIPTNYAAPEVILDDRGTAPMDMWSSGCTLYEMRLGQRLFDVFQLLNTRKEDYLDEISSLLGKPPEPWAELLEPDDGSDTVEASVRLYLPEERTHSIHERLASSHDCSGPDCEHPRFEQISEAEAAALADLLEKLLRYRAEERLSVEEVLKHPWLNIRF